MNKFKAITSEVNEKSSSVHQSCRNIFHFFPMELYGIFVSKNVLEC